jgi:hypothetical protein
MAFQLRTRPPTGRAPWPLILIEGPEKSGKTWACAQFSACQRIGQTYWIDLGEGAADEYGAIPGARYLVVEHDGTWPAILASVQAIRDDARRAADAGAPPVVLVIDSLTAEWELHKDWVSNVAKERLARKGRRLQPDEDPKISMDLWNAATARHRKLMTILMTFPGIVLVTARGKDVAALDAAGRPIEGSKEYKVEGQKTLAFDASVWVRMSRDTAPVIVGARSVHAGLRPGVDKPKPAPNFSLEWLVFDVLRCDPADCTPRNLVEAQPGSAEPDPQPPVTEADEPAAPPSAHATRLSAAVSEATDEEQLRALWSQIKPALDAGEITAAQADEIAAHIRTNQQRLASHTPMVEQHQHRRMHALWRQLGLDGEQHREERLRRTAEIVGLESLESSANLTRDQADQVIAALNNLAQQKQGAPA